MMAAELLDDVRKQVIERCFLRRASEVVDVLE